MDKNKVLKNYLYDLSYQILLVVTPLITTPYISRVLGAENLGIYGYISSIATYFVLFGTLGTSLYGRREIAYYQDNLERRTQVFLEIFLMRLFFTGIASLIYIVGFCFGVEYTLIYRFFLIDIIANVCDVSWFFQGIQDFKKTVIRNVIVKILGILLIFLLVKSESHLWIYTLCTILPTLIGHLTLWFYLKEYVKFGKIRIRPLRHILPIFTLFIPQIAIEIYTVLDKTMIGALYSDYSQVGYYMQAQKIITITLKVVTSLSVVMLPAMALDYMKGNCEKLCQSVQQSFRFMSFVGIPIMFGVMAIADNFVPWFFGPGYEPVILLLKIISPIIVVIGYSTVIGSQYLLATQKQNIYTGSVIAGAITNFICNFLLIPPLGAVGASLASVIAEFMVSAIQVYFTKDILPILKYTMENLKYFISSVVMAVIVYFVGKLFAPSILVTVIQIGLGGMIYILIMYVLRDQMLMLGIDVIRKKGQV